MPCCRRPGTGGTPSAADQGAGKPQPRRDRSPDGPDAAWIGKIDLRLGAVPGLVVHTASSFIDHRDVAHGRPGGALRPSGAEPGPGARPRLGYELVPDKRSAGRWQTSCRGVYLAAGMRGPIIGRRADLAIIDDPVKSQAEADNAAASGSVWDWSRSDLVTRLKPGGRIVLIMTRWHEDDLGGRLLAQQRDQWRVCGCRRLPRPTIRWARPRAPLWPDWERRRRAKTQARLDRRTRLVRVVPAGATPPDRRPVQGAAAGICGRSDPACQRGRCARLGPCGHARRPAATTRTGRRGSSCGETPPDATRCSTCAVCAAHHARWRLPIVAAARADGDGRDDRAAGRSRARRGKARCPIWPACSPAFGSPHPARPAPS